jgi:hypothetical protein
MLRSLNNLLKLGIAATDGELGGVHDFCFDDWEWSIRYLVVDTGKWLPGRRVLISPVSIGRADWDGPLLHLNLTQEQIKDGPGIETDRPVSRQQEERLVAHYGWPTYWGSGAAAPVWPGAQASTGEQSPGPGAPKADPRLRSAKEVTGYHIEATDGEIGHVEDFLLNDEDWRILYMIVGIRNWLPGRKVLVAPMWIRSVRWNERMVHVDMTRAQVEGSPEYDPSTPVNRDYETELFNYYGRPKYWL